METLIGFKFKAGDKVKIPTHKYGMLISVTAKDLGDKLDGETFSVHVSRSIAKKDKYMVVKKVFVDGIVAIVSVGDIANNGDYFSQSDLQLYNPFEEQIENELGINNL